MTNSKEECPIPFYQQPLNEYKALKGSCFFSWPTLGLENFIIKLMILWLIASVLIIPIVNNIFSMSAKLGKAMILDIIFSSMILLVSLVRLYLAWSYIMHRLLSAIVSYEESGWYDGQVWIKPSKVLMQDRLIGMYEVVPLLKLVRGFLLVIVLLFLVEVIIYFGIQ